MSSVMQATGFVVAWVLVMAAVFDWSAVVGSGEGGRPVAARCSNSILVAYDDGDLVIEAPGGAAIWSSATTGIGPSTLEVHDDGTLRIHDALDLTHWTALPDVRNGRRRAVSRVEVDLGFRTDPMPESPVVSTRT